MPGCTGTTTWPISKQSDKGNPMKSSQILAFTLSLALVACSAGPTHMPAPPRASQPSQGASPIKVVTAEAEATLTARGERESLRLDLSAFARQFRTAFADP